MNYKHGGRRTPEYNIWGKVKRRCENPADPAYPNYGGRGISLCPEWHDFGRFYADMGPRPNGSATLERIDNNRGYEPGNCRWATRTEQGRNKRNNVLITIDGEAMPLSAWAERVGLKYRTIHQRIAIGWDPVTAVKTPLVTHRKGIPRGERIHAFGAKHGVRFLDDEQEAA